MPNWVLCENCGAESQTGSNRGYRCHRCLMELPKLASGNPRASSGANSDESFALPLLLIGFTVLAGFLASGFILVVFIPEVIGRTGAWGVLILVAIAILFATILLAYMTGSKKPG